MDYPKVERPAEPGWYWHRDCDDWVCIQIGRNLRNTLVWVRDGYLTSVRVDQMIGEWRGPIPEPTP